MIFNFKSLNKHTQEFECDYTLIHLVKTGHIWSLFILVGLLTNGHWNSRAGCYKVLKRYEWWSMFRRCKSLRNAPVFLPYVIYEKLCQYHGASLLGCEPIDGIQGVLRPDSIDLLFLWSFPYPFERVERDKNKRKRGKNLHENTIISEKNSY